MKAFMYEDDVVTSKKQFFKVFISFGDQLRGTVRHEFERDLNRFAADLAAMSAKARKRAYQHLLAELEMDHKKARLTV